MIPTERMTGCTLLAAYAEGRRDFIEASLSGADLSGADLSGAKSVIDAGIDRRGYRFVGVAAMDGWRVKAGCRWFTIPEAVAHWAANNNDDALRRVRLIAETPLGVRP